MTHTLETTAISRVVARALRLNEDLDRGDRARARHGPHPVRARRRGRARRGVAGAVRPPLPTQRAVAVDRAIAQPHTRGLRRDPHTHGGARARDARGEDRAARRPRRVHQPRHRRRRAVRAAERGRPATRRDRRPRPTGSNRIDTLVRDIVDESDGVDDIRQSPEVGEAMLSLRAFMFERVYLDRKRRRSTPGRTRSCAESSTASSNAATMRTRSSTTSPA